MKTTIAILVLITGLVHAQSEVDALTYLTGAEPGTTGPCLMQDHNGMRTSGTTYTIADVRAATNTVAFKAWYAARQDAKATVKADYDNWTSAELKALCKVLLSEINILRKQAGLTERTADQLKAAIKAEVAK